MSHLAEEEAQFPGSNHEELIFQCDASDGDYLRITWDDDPDWRFLWMEATIDFRWRSRIKAAWRTLRGKHPEQATMILNDHAVRNLTAFLSGVNRDEAQQPTQDQGSQDESEPGEAQAPRPD